MHALGIAKPRRRLVRQRGVIWSKAELAHIDEMARRPRLSPDRATSPLSDDAHEEAPRPLRRCRAFCALELGSSVSLAALGVPMEEADDDKCDDKTSMRLERTPAAPRAHTPIPAAPPPALSGISTRFINLSL